MIDTIEELIETMTNIADSGKTLKLEYAEMCYHVFNTCYAAINDFYSHARII